MVQILTEYKFSDGLNELADKLEMDQFLPVLIKIDPLQRRVCGCACVRLRVSACVWVCVYQEGVVKTGFPLKSYLPGLAMRE